jgi:hypothetical protein
MLDEPIYEFEEQSHDEEQQWIEEEIDGQEVEAVVNALSELIESVESETIAEHLVRAHEAISELADWEEDEPEAEAA